MESVPKEQFLTNLGYSTPDAQAKAKSALEEEGLTNPRNKQIAAWKAHGAAEVLRSRFFRHCGSLSCASRGAVGERERVLVPRRDCEGCGLEVDHLSEEMIRACAQVGIERSLVVGGGPSQRPQLLELIGTDIRLDFVDGERSVNPRRIRELSRRADVIVIWGSTIITHAHTKTVTKFADPSRTIVISRRSVRALLKETTEHLRRRAGAGRPLAGRV